MSERVTASVRLSWLRLAGLGLLVVAAVDVYFSGISGILGDFMDLVLMGQ